jgi:hypothetical protein
MRPWMLRAAAVIVLVPWVAALFSTTRSTVYGLLGSDRDTAGTGWVLAAWGWLGPVMGIVAWYANPLLAWMLVRLARGRSPGTRLSAIGLALALTSLLPSCYWDVEVEGKLHLQTITGPAIWLWISSFVICFAIARAVKGSA